MSHLDKEELLANLLTTPGGKRMLADSMSQPLKLAFCPVCGEHVPDLMAHCDEVGDPEHLAAFVMET